MNQPNIITPAERRARKVGCSTCGKSSKPMSDLPQLPSKWDMLKNLVIAAKDAISSGLDVRTPEDTEKALKLCAECPYLAGDEIHPRCGHCGCHLRLKVQLTGWHCPIGKW